MTLTLYGRRGASILRALKTADKADSKVILLSFDDRRKAMNIPILYTDNPTVDMAFRIAVGDFVSNIAPFQGGVLKEKAPVMLAGLGYDTPWTRDGAINNGTAVVCLRR